MLVETAWAVLFDLSAFIAKILTKFENRNLSQNWLSFWNIYDQFVDGEANANNLAEYTIILSSILSMAFKALTQFLS